MDTISIRIPDLPIPAVNCTLSFRPYLSYIESQISTTSSGIYKTFLESIAELIKKSPELMEPITDYGILDNHKELIELIKITHLSQVKTDEKLIALGLPSGNPPHINYFGYSDEFAAFFREKGPSLRLNSKIVGEEFHRNTYREVLKKSYNVDSQDYSVEPMLQLVYEVNHVKHYYKVVRRHLFADVVMKEELPELKQEWIDYASGLIASRTELKEPLPFEKFPIEGFFIFSVLPETQEMALVELNNIITEIHTNDSDETTDKLKQATLSLLGGDNLELGFLAFLKVNDKYVYHDFYSKISLVFGKLKKHFTTEELSEVYMGIVTNTLKYSTTLSSLNNDLCEVDEDCTGAINHVRTILDKEGLNVLKFIPVWHNDILLGVIELGAKNEADITVEILQKLNSAIPVYREFFLYKVDAFYDFMKSFIMQRYTSIQQSVAWKFNEEVWNTIKIASSPKDVMNTPPVRFENLYPFYGAVDFRDSSKKQLEAIRADYQTQIKYLEQLIPKELSNDEILNEFKKQITYWIEQLSNSTDIQEESGLRYLLETESLSFVNHLGKQGIIDASIVDFYIDAVSSKFGKFHVFHNKYEESLQELNRVLREELFKAEVALQEKAPHYFEKFQTDGIEYSLYAGKSINPLQPFPSNGLEIIIEWQLNVMLQMAIAASEQRKYLSVPLETTQLILVHENLVDISYRIDERHFDVEGSYSIRYQVLKKRIDKVRIANSSERLTQPGTLAIVFANRKSIDMYLQKIGKLVAAGKLSPDIEYLDLEQLQGIGKMMAIRVKINMDTNGTFNEGVSDIVALNI